MASLWTGQRCRLAKEALESGHLATAISAQLGFILISYYGNFKFLC
jgi:hypothetical protein